MLEEKERERGLAARVDFFDAVRTLNVPQRVDRGPPQPFLGECGRLGSESARSPLRRPPSRLGELVLSARAFSQFFGDLQLGVRRVEATAADHEPLCAPLRRGGREMHRR